MNISLVLLFGFFVGVLARLVVPGREPGGWAASILLGVLGSFAGGFLAQLLGTHGDGRAVAVFMPIAGAVLILFGYRAVAGRRASV